MKRNCSNSYRVMSMCAPFALLVTFLFAGCGGGKSLSSPQIYGSKPASSEQEKEKEKTSGTDTAAKPEENGSTKATSTGTEPFGRDAVISGFSDDESGSEALTDDPYGEDNSGEAQAIDDEVWRQFDLAEEYHSLGVIANREGSWEEAQYYFEKTLTILADMDIETDSVFSPEAVKYTTILNNTIADYKVSLRSLGRLSDDASSSVILDRFVALSEQLKRDTIVTEQGLEDGLTPTFDLPIVMNDRVKSSIVYFQTVAKDAFTRYLSRSTKYKPMMLRIIREYNMPEDLIYLSLVESGYNPHAYSWARAMGLWQFISSTGKLYGLDRDWWMDERKDPIKSTHAAMRFLGDLYAQFGDWELAMAAYNGGPGRVKRTIESQNTRDFWKMRLRKQTMDYVPLIMAAAIIAKNPKKYGFDDITYEAELAWDEVKVNKPLELNVVAGELGVPEDALVNLNPELLRKTTPPGVKDYVLKVPSGYGERFYASYDDMEEATTASWVRYRIKTGDNLSSIASKYGVSRYAIQEANKEMLKGKSTLYAGKTLLIPVPSDRRASGESTGREYAAKNSVYTVRRGDNLWAIANAFGTSVSELRRENYLGGSARIYVGQKLKIPGDASQLDDKNSYASAPQPAAKQSTSSVAVADGTAKNHRVRSGETLSTIARKYGTSVSALKRLNGMGTSNRIQAGQLLKVTGSEEESTSDYVIHQIRRGENLSSIARKYKTTVDKILSVNKIADPDHLMTGQSLTIYLE